MNERDYAEEYQRRLEAEEYQRRLEHLSAGFARLRAEVQKSIDQYDRPLRAEDYPDPTRSKTAWDEDTQSKVRVRTEVDSHAIDRGEG